MAEQAQTDEASQAARSGKGKNLPEPTSLTETVLAFAGGLCVLFGMLAAGRILLASAGSYQSPWILALTALLSGLMSALMFFAAHLALQYLRRIMNAVEGRSKSNPARPGPPDSND